MLKLSRILNSCARTGVLNLSQGGLVSSRFNCRPSHLRLQVRYLSAGDVFGKVDASKLVDLPASPLPLPPKIPVEELISSGQSILKELDLFSWSTPPSYIRYALESLHLHCDLPWWLTIATVSVTLRLLTVYVPIMSQRLVAIQSRYRTDMKKFNDRINDARMEGDNMMVHQILMEQHTFMKSKGIRIGRQAVVMLVNGGIFLTNFFAIKQMVHAKYPGFETGGTLWFPNLLETDPYMGLPALSAISTFIVLKVGIDSGGTSDQMTPTTKICMQYGLPLFVFASGWWFSSAICIHWVASNAFSLGIAGLFRLNPVRKFLNIPAVVKHDKSLDVNPFKEVWNKNRMKKKPPPDLSTLRKTDYEKFKQAGRGRPMI